MPFITEEIYQALPHEGDILMLQPYPRFSDELTFPEDEAAFESVMNAIRAVRSRRAEMRVPPSKRPHLLIVTEKTRAFESGRAYLSKLAYAGEVSVTGENPSELTGMVSIVTEDARMFMPLAELVDLAAERARIEKELEKAKKDLENQRKKLSNDAFLSRAPEHVVNTERERAAKLEALCKNLEASLLEM
jgi:valyl-tRNA synthetase